MFLLGMESEISMIYESYVWKQELKKELNKFQKLISNMDLSKKAGVPDNVNIKIEKFFFVSSFIIRKLNEAEKLSNEFNSTRVPVSRFKRINKVVRIHNYNNHRIEEFYNLDKGEISSLKIATLCNDLIHSFIFRCVFEDELVSGKEKLSGVVFNSEHTKNSYLHFIEIYVFINLIENAIKDYISYSYHDFSQRKSLNMRNKPTEAEFSRLLDYCPTFPDDVEN